MQEIKSEILPSVPLTFSHYDGTSSGGTLDVIDKWRSRVLFHSPKKITSDDSSIEEESWSKKFEKQLAILKVAFPFLTESQIHGKAWENCGLSSVMGGLPRSGLTPEVKKEFSKHRTPRSRKESKFRSRTQPNMARKLKKVKKELMKAEKNTENLYNFTSPSMNTASPQSIIEKSAASNQLESFQYSILTQMSGVNVLTATSHASNEEIKIPDQLKTPNSAQKSNCKPEESVIIPETAELSFRTNSPYCSQSLKTIKVVNDPESLDNVIPSLAARSNCCSPQKISEFSTTLKSDGSVTASGLDDFGNLSKTQSQVINNFSQYVNHPSPSVPVRNLSCQNSPLQEEACIPTLRDEYCTPIHKKSLNMNNIEPYYEMSPPLSVSNQKSFDQNCSMQKECEDVMKENSYFTPVNQIISRNDINHFYKSLNKRSSNSLQDSPLENTPILEVASPVRFENLFQHVTPEAIPVPIVEDNVDATISNFYNNRIIPSEQTPVKNLKISEAKKKISFEVIAEIYHRDSSFFGDEPFETETEQAALTNSTATECVIISTPNDNNFEAESQNSTYRGIMNSSIPKSKADYSNINDQRFNQEGDLKDDESLLGQLHQQEIDLLSYDFNDNEMNKTREYSNSLEVNLSVQSPQILGLTPEQLELPQSILMSNYSSEYDKAYARKDLKPSMCRNYYSNRVDISLKEHFDQIIPSEKSLQEFFNPLDKSSKKITKEINKTVNDIISTLEDDETQDTC